MVVELFWRQGETPVGRFRVLGSWADRLLGLLGTRRDAMPVLIVPCRSIHSFGMRYRIDVALVGDGGVVLKSRRDLVPGRVFSHGRAIYALERPSSCRPWPNAGDVLVCPNLESGVEGRFS